MGNIFDVVKGRSIKIASSFKRDQVESWTRKINYEVSVGDCCSHRGKWATKCLSITKIQSAGGAQGIRQNWGLLYMTITRTWGIGTALLNHMIGVAGMKKLDKV